MKKIIGLTGIFIITLIISGVVWFWPVIEIGFDGSAHYTEQDSRRYKLLTHDLLKGMPRISARYDFDFANIAGPATFVWTVTFYGTEDIHDIETYLIAKGYKRQATCDVEADCWLTSASKDMVTTGRFTTDKTVMVQIQERTRQ
ncbi:hypothetical protein [Erwinia sp. 9145]|uniref:hypothetical protein n=1 Tax=Erwinia sp. 9145 TaxID=1500895 RepID=UPI00055352C6|nr:hypothetical protein [Erwinia sp. 9145]